MPDDVTASTRSTDTGSTTKQTAGPPSDGILIAGLTAAAYLTAFAYEAGSARAFGVPFELIDLQLVPAIFTAILALSVGLVALFNLADPLYDFLTPKLDEHPVLRRLRPFLAVLAILIVFRVVGGAVVQRQLMWFAVLMMLFAAWHFLLLPLVLLRRVPGGYAAKMGASFAIDAQFQGPFTKLMLGTLGWVTTWLFLTALIAGLSYTAGYSQERSRKDFFVTNQQPEAVVLRIYGNRAITAELIRMDRRIRPIYRVMKVDEGLTIRMERIGPISIAE